MKAHIVKALHKALEKLDVANTHEILVENTNKLEFGDYTTNLPMRLSKALNKKPTDIARDISSHFVCDNITAEATLPGYINFTLGESIITRSINTLFDQKHVPNKGRAIVEFSSPNIAKPFTVGHLRSTIIGNAVANLLEETCYSVLRDNHLGDWGTQFGKQIYAIKHLSSLSDIEKRIQQGERPVKVLVELYQEFYNKAQVDEKLEDVAREYFKKLEGGDREMRALWQQCIDWSWIEFEDIYKKLGIEFAQEFNGGRGLGESFFEDKMQVVLDELRASGYIKKGVCMQHEI
jgi:arginyl-tRNA synthetase